MKITNTKIITKQLDLFEKYIKNFKQINKILGMPSVLDTTQLEMSIVDIYKEVEQLSIENIECASVVQDTKEMDTLLLAIKKFDASLDILIKQSRQHD